MGSRLSDKSHLWCARSADSIDGIGDVKLAGSGITRSRSDGKTLGVDCCTLPAFGPDGADGLCGSSRVAHVPGEANHMFAGYMMWHTGDFWAQSGASSAGEVACQRLPQLRRAHLGAQPCRTATSRVKPTGMARNGWPGTTGRASTWCLRCGLWRDCWRWDSHWRCFSAAREMVWDGYGVDC